MLTLSSIAVAIAPIPTAMRFSAGALAAVFVPAFRVALVVELARFRFFFGGLVVCCGPITAVRVEMPGVSVAFATRCGSHSVLCSF